HLAPIPGIDQIFLVSNARCADDFQARSDGYRKKEPKLRMKIVNDGSTDESNKLGAIGDVNLVLHQEKILNKDLLVVAGDNLFSKSQVKFAEFAKTKPAAIASYDVGCLEAIRKYSCLTLNENGRVEKFVEKPEQPESTLTGIGLYHYSTDILPLFETYMDMGNNPDQPGLFVQWLHRRVATYSYPVEGLWYDIGSKDNLEEANEIFGSLAAPVSG
ncbi:MAG: sugar phosphate nucleotidyltransferase, partial [Verrucomicrobiota bacterium]